MYPSQRQSYRVLSDLLYVESSSSSRLVLPCHLWTIFQSTIHPKLIFVTTVYINTVTNKIFKVQNLVPIRKISYLSREMFPFPHDIVNIWTCPVHLLYFNYYFPFYWKQLGQILLRGHKAVAVTTVRCFLEHGDLMRLTPACNIDSQAFNMNGQDIFIMISGLNVTFFCD